MKNERQKLIPKVKSNPIDGIDVYSTVILSRRWPGICRFLIDFSISIAVEMYGALSHRTASLLSQICSRS